jgi:hypothetical protein
MTPRNEPEVDWPPPCQDASQTLENDTLTRNGLDADVRLTVVRVGRLLPGAQST